MAKIKKLPKTASIDHTLVPKIVKDNFESDENAVIRNKVRAALIECRTANGLTQTEAGKIVGKSKTTVASWEQGLSMPDAPTLYRLAKYYDKSIAYMYGETT